MFLALRGERFDGHEYLALAANAGSPVLIVDDERRGNAAAGGDSGPGVLKVTDTRRALLALG
ncbi:MAG TPA: hypothetical protein VG797_04235, partial [Phycisphaerales bacterium]|nr:hypothetical protein [Phycisphaerales bacterium]